VFQIRLRIGASACGSSAEYFLEQLWVSNSARSEHEWLQVVSAPPGGPDLNEVIRW
jgi:hypothetical protein